MEMQIEHLVEIGKEFLHLHCLLLAEDPFYNFNSKNLEPKFKKKQTFFSEKKQWTLCWIISEKQFFGEK